MKIYCIEFQASEVDAVTNGGGRFDDILTLSIAVIIQFIARVIFKIILLYIQKYLQHTFFD
jgi:hypothetical protein